MMRDMKKNLIKECCASCRHKTIDEEGTRICAVMQIVVEQRMKCRKWECEESLRSLSWHKGRIKRREYLMFVFEVRMQEREAIDDGTMLPEDTETPDSLRKRFEEETGLPPYVIY